MAAAGHFLTFNVVKLELLSNGQVLGNATGFFVKRADKWWLVSNWHAVSGRNPTTGQPRQDNGAVPDIVRYSVLKKIGDDILVETFTHPLGDSLAGTATWIEHPTKGQDVDIAAIEIDAARIGSAKDILNPDGYDADMFMDLGSEVFVPGFPLGLGVGPMPIWKRASMASSLEIGPGVDNTFLIDTATREGMSGAPCFAISNWRHYRLDRITNKVAVVERPISHRILGVYSGRLLADDNFGAQLGVVWRDTLMFETLDGAKLGSVQLR